MTATYTYFAKDVVFAANKCMASIFNNTGTAVTVKVYRMYVLNNQYNAVTGVLTNLEIRKLTSSSGGTTITAAPHDTTNTLSASVACATNASVASSDLYRRVLWSTDEPSNTAATVMTVDEFQCFLPIGCVWSMGYGDTNVDPITLNANEGIGIINTGAVAGTCDIIIEFTSA